MVLRGTQPCWGGTWDSYMQSLSCSPLYVFTSVKAEPYPSMTDCSREWKITHRGKHSHCKISGRKLKRQPPEGQWKGWFSPDSLQAPLNGLGRNKAGSSIVDLVG